MKTHLLPKETYVEVALTCKSPTDSEQAEIQSFFQKLRVPSDQRAISFFESQFQHCFYTRSLRIVEKAKKEIRHIRSNKIQLKVKVLGRADWLDKWMLDYHISRFGQNFMIVPIWEKEEFRSKNKIPIYMNPQGAFGSGTHETTCLVIQLMERLDGKFNNFLDVGVGTGILSIAAHYLGAKESVGFDYDEKAVKASKWNLKLNNINSSQIMRKRLEEVQLTKKYDLVAANVISKHLLDNRKKLVNSTKKRGYLIVSGILLEHFEDFKKQFKHPQLHCIKILKSKEWASVLYKKK